MTEDADKESNYSATGGNDLLLAAVVNGDLEGLKVQITSHEEDVQRLSLLTASHQDRDNEGTLLHFAIFHNHHHIVSWLWSEMIQLMGSAKTVQEKTHAPLYAFTRKRYQIVFLLLSLGATANQQDSVGNTILHLCCDQPKPPIEFMRKLCKAKGLNPNIRNNEDFIPLHLLCLRCNGIEGKEAMLFLKAVGTDLDAMTRDGRLPAQLTRNFYIRQALSLQSPARGRPLPRLQLDEEEAMAATSFTELFSKPLEPLIDVKDLKKPKEDADHPKSKKLTTDDQEEINDRLYSAPLKHNIAVREAAIAKYVTSPKWRVMQAEEIEEFTHRHFYEQMERRSAKNEELQEKYATEMAAPTQLSPEEVVESVQRLHDASMDKTRTKMKELHKKYVASSGPKSIHKDPAAIQEAVKVLYDKAVADHYSRHREAAEKYTQPLYTSKRMTKEQMQASAARLYNKT